MNIYLLSPTDAGREQQCLDAYDLHVVIAESHSKARKLCPSGDEGADFWTTACLSLCTLIGRATGTQAPHVVVSSFRAG